MCNVWLCRAIWSRGQRQEQEGTLATLSTWPAAFSFPRCPHKIQLCFVYGMQTIVRALAQYCLAFCRVHARVQATRSYNKHRYSPLSCTVAHVGLYTRPFSACSCSAPVTACVVYQPAASFFSDPSVIYSPKPAQPYLHAES